MSPDGVEAADYDRRSEALRATIDDYDEEGFHARIEELVENPVSGTAVEGPRA